MTYFDHSFVSNSDLKDVMELHSGREKPDNIQEIYDLGTLNHEALLEHYKAKRWLERVLDEARSDEVRVKLQADYDLACTMAKTVLADKLCRSIIMQPDFKREHEIYRLNRFGLEGTRVKCDGISKGISTIFEYKGLAITTENGFYQALERFEYDQSAFWYLENGDVERYLLAGVSKKQPKKLFKCLIDRKHEYFASGQVKAERAIRRWKLEGFK